MLVSSLCTTSPLRRLPNQFIPRRFDYLGGLFDHLPLRRCG
jgi:hypothetical protein